MIDVSYIPWYSDADSEFLVMRRYLGYIAELWAVKVSTRSDRSAVVDAIFVGSGT